MFLVCICHHIIDDAGHQPPNVDVNSGHDELTCHLPLGTTRYFDDPSQPQAADEQHGNLKRARIGEETIILVRFSGSCTCCAQANTNPRSLNLPMIQTIR
jgi:hypothetical protein